MNYYHIDKDTFTIISGPHAVRSTYVKMLASCGNPECLDLSQYDLVPQVCAPLTEGQKHGAPAIYADRVEIPAIAKTAEELAGELAGKLTQIDDAARAYIASQIDPDGMILVTRLSAAGHPYGTAVEQWLVRVRIEHARRKAVVEAGVEDFSSAHLDYNSFEDKPYTAAQLMMAAGIGAQGESI